MVLIYINNLNYDLIEKEKSYGKAATNKVTKPN
jgi:hypothetical protein